MMPMMRAQSSGIDPAADIGRHDVPSQRCVREIEARMRKRCRSMVERSLAMATRLAPVIGYDRAAAVVKQAWTTGPDHPRGSLELGRARRDRTQRAA